MINVFAGKDGIQIGSFADEGIDVEDLLRLDDLDDNTTTRLASLLHEIYEQYLKQVKGNKYKEAHSLAVIAESDFLGRVRADPHEDGALDGGGFWGKIKFTHKDGTVWYLYIEVKPDGTITFEEIIQAEDAE